MPPVTKKNQKSKPGCVAAALTILGDKWTGLIVQQLVQGPKCYTDLATNLSGISPRTLSARIDKLLASGVISKEIYCSHPPRYEYSLTKKGEELEKILKAMVNWGDKYS